MVVEQGVLDWRLVGTEQRLLLASIRDDVRPPFRVPGSPRELELSLFQSLVRHHRLLPQVFAWLSAAPQGDWSGLAESYRVQHRDHVIRSTWMAHQMTRCADLLLRGGIEVVCYKGPVLAHGAFGDLGARQFDDLDFFVRRDSVSAVHQILERAGYVPRFRYSRLQRAVHMRLDMETAFLGGGIAHDIHWRFGATWLDLSPPLDALMGRTLKRNVLGADLPVFSPHDEVLLLCVEALHDGWTRLSAARDIAGIVARWQEADWARLLACCACRSLRVAVLLGLSVTTAVLGTALPPAVLREIEAVPALGRLTALAVGTVLRSRPVPSTIDARVVRLHLAASPSATRRLRYLLLRSLVPTARDWEQVHVPDVLFPFYLLLRPCRLAVSAIRRPSR